MRNKYLALAVTALLALGAGCTSTTTDTTTTNTTNANTTTSSVTVDADDTVVDTEDVDTADSEDSDVDATETDATDTAEADEVDTTETDITDEEDADESDDEETAEDTTEDSAEADTVATTQTFDIVASQFEFTPGTITVQKGDTVVLNLSSEDVPHGFSLAQFDISETLTPGKTKTVEFVADTAGTFSFFCSIVCGSGHGSMTGQLVVEE
jgi:cytochrome c oxidase subunit 2